MTVKVIALKTINKTPPGGELEVSAPVADVLVRLGNARYADPEEQRATQVERPGGSRRRNRTATGGAVAAATTKNVQQA